MKKVFLIMLCLFLNACSTGGECTGHYDETPEVRMNISFGVK